MNTREAKSYERPACEMRLVEDDLLERGVDLVRRMAFRMARRLPSNIDVDDLVGAGMEGLVRAIDSFDPNKGIKFNIYAKVRIRGAILDELRA